jgi:hypothetical protein
LHAVIVYQQFCSASEPFKLFGICLKSVAFGRRHVRTLISDPARARNGAGLLTTGCIYAPQEFAQSVHGHCGLHRSLGHRPAGRPAWAANGGAADGEAQAFDFEALKRQAKQLAGSLSGHQTVLPPTLATMTPQNFNAIRYDGNHSLWNEQGSAGRAVFPRRHGFPPAGAHVQRRSEDPHRARVHFRPTLFNYENTTVDTQQLKGDLGFSGFKLFKAPELDRHDVVSFLGASYFRAVDATGQYGLSARGLASTPTPKSAKSSLTSPSSGSRLRSRTPRVLWSTPCSTRRARPAPIASTSIARPSAW